MINIVLFGPPGAGKGTQATRLAEKFNLFHISTGDVFRRNLKEGTELGKLAQKYMDNGDYVPDNITIKMLNEEVNNHKDQNGFIFDGFPRTVNQAEALDELMASKGQIINKMLALEVPDDILIDRLVKRGESSGRADDTDKDVIQNRIKVYYDQTASLKDYYTDQGKCEVIDGVGDIDEITQRIVAAVES